MYTTNNWEALVNQGVGSTHTVKPISTNEEVATVVEIKRRERDSYGEAYEGEGDAYVIFQVGSRFFRKKFWESSYNEYDLTFWDDEPEEVFGQVKTTTIFVPKER